jgi:hypothetical protein
MAEDLNVCIAVSFQGKIDTNDRGAPWRLADLSIGDKTDIGRCFRPGSTPCLAIRLLNFFWNKRVR